MTLLVHCYLDENSKTETTNLDATVAPLLQPRVIIWKIVSFVKKCLFFNPFDFYYILNFSHSLFSLFLTFERTGHSPPIMCHFVEDTGIYEWSHWKSEFLVHVNVRWNSSSPPALFNLWQPLIIWSVKWGQHFNSVSQRPKIYNNHARISCNYDTCQQILHCGTQLIWR